MIRVIHFQFITDKGETLEKLLKSNRQFLASIVPNLLEPSMRTETGKDIFERIHSKNNYYPTWFIEEIKKNKDNPNIVWIQEGFRHCCERCAEKYEKNVSEGRGKHPDRYHEHVCLDGHSQSFEEQKNNIEKGRKILTKLGINPLGYCPPNHLFNEDTFRAVKDLGFKYVLIRAKTEVPVYQRDNGLIVIPEGKLKEVGENATALYTYYDGLTEKMEEPVTFLEKSSLLSEVKPKKMDGNLASQIEENERLKLLAKFERDLRYIKKS
ncbi:MAG: DUF2334 domain-containing protein [Nanoarchaeota archaeon]|nr:DUF2334 domain-containing protein [Nanoarchaeota archaeon]